MVNHFPTNPRARRQSGMLMTDILIALSILTLTVLPLTGAYVEEQRATRHLYQNAVAMEIIDGEMEILAAGEWHSFKEGAQAYPLNAAAAKSLPPGKVTLTIAGKNLRLEWKPEKALKGDTVVREAIGK